MDPTKNTLEQFHPMPWMDCIHILGDDAEAFLQGQLSQDLQKVCARQARFASYNSPKGRMLAVMMLFRTPDGFAILLNHEISQMVVRRLGMFVLRSKVEIRHRAAPVLARLQPEQSRVQAEALSVEHAGTESFVRMPARHPGTLCIDWSGSGREMPTSDVQQPDWRRADIEAGIPVVQAKTQDKWVAQMANLDQLGGISFEKGCYTGQEVIARIHYLGKLKKRMFRLEGFGNAPNPGDGIYLGNASGQSVGDIVDAVPNLSGDRFLASAVLQISAATSSDLVLAGESDIRLAVPTEYAY